MGRLYSIIISGYKDSAIHTLEWCLNLAISERVDYEIIFLDNTARSVHAETVAALARRRGRPHPEVRYLPHRTAGKAGAQNQGIRAARGEILVFLDDDVEPEPDLIIQYDEGFELHPCSAIQGKVRLGFGKGVQVPAWLDKRFRLDLAEMDWDEPLIPFTMGLTGANMALKAALFEKYGLYDERLGPGRSGTLEDQEYSERIRAGGETQLYWPAAAVTHLIPQRRLRIGNLARTYYDVGHSEYFLSGHLIRGGIIRFTLYTLKCCLLSAGMIPIRAAQKRPSEAIRKYCELYHYYGYWRQAVREHGSGTSRNEGNYHSHQRS